MFLCEKKSIFLTAPEFLRGLALSFFAYLSLEQWHLHVALRILVLGRWGDDAMQGVWRAKASKVSCNVAELFLITCYCRASGQ